MEHNNSSSQHYKQNISGLNIILLTPQYFLQVLIQHYLPSIETYEGPDMHMTLWQVYDLWHWHENSKICTTVLCISLWWEEGKQVSCSDKTLAKCFCSWLIVLRCFIMKHKRSLIIGTAWDIFTWREGRKLKYKQCPRLFTLKVLKANLNIPTELDHQILSKFDGNLVNWLKMRWDAWIWHISSQVILRKHNLASVLRLWMCFLTKCLQNILNLPKNNFPKTFKSTTSCLSSIQSYCEMKNWIWNIFFHKSCKTTVTLTLWIFEIFSSLKIRSRKLILYNGLIVSYRCS